MNSEERQFCFRNKQFRQLKEEKCEIMNMPSKSSLLCNRRCAKPLARFDLPSFFYTPIRSAVVNYAKLGQWEKHYPEMLTSNIKCPRAHCRDFATCFRPSKYQEGKVSHENM